MLLFFVHRLALLGRRVLAELHGAVAQLELLTLLGQDI